MIDYRFRAEEFVDRAILDEVEFEYLYNEGDEFHFMNTENYEQMQMSREELGETVFYLIPNTKVKVEFLRRRPSAWTYRTPWKCGWCRPSPRYKRLRPAR